MGGRAKRSEKPLDKKYSIHYTVSQFIVGCDNVRVLLLTMWEGGFHEFLEEM